MHAREFHDDEFDIARWRGLTAYDAETVAMGAAADYADGKVPACIWRAGCSSWRLERTDACAACSHVTKTAA